MTNYRTNNSGSGNQKYQQFWFNFKNEKIFIFIMTNW